MAIRYLSGVNIDSNTLFVDDVNNRVGIGTSQPSTNLNVVVDPNGGNPHTYSRIHLKGGTYASMSIGSPNSGSAWYMFGDTDDAYVAGMAYEHATDSMYFNVNNATALYINSSRNVGIGTTAPTSKLEVVNSGGIPSTNLLSSFINEGAQLQINVTSAATGSALVDLLARSGGSGNTSSADFSFSTRNAGTIGERMRITAGGNVGIGTTSPDVKLQVDSSNIAAFFKSTGNSVPVSIFNSASSISTIGFKGSTTTDEYRVRVGADGNDFIAYTANVERLRILNGGNVGIGTTAPGAALDVKGHAHIDQYAAGTVSPHTAGYLRLISSSKTGWYSGDELGKIEFYSVDGSGIGARNAASIRAVNSQGNGTSTTTFNGELAFYTSAYNAAESEAVRINSAGSVGIGTAGPVYKLDVLVPNSSGDTKQNVQQWGQLNQNTLQLNMYGGSTDLVQFAAVNSEQNISIVTEDSGSLTASTSKGIYIKSGGNVGIGTTSPAEKLDISGNIKLPSTSGNGLFFVSGSAPSGISWYSQPGTSDGPQLISYGSAHVIIDSDNNDADTRFFTIRKNGTNYSNSTELLRVTEAGNVGIGTTTPTTYDAAKIGSSHRFLNVQSGANLYSVFTLAGNQSNDGDRIGYVTFVNDANSSSYKYTAWIGSEVEGATAGQRGSRLIFSTMGNGSAAGPIERLRISSTGAAKLSAYGSGSITGTATYGLAVDASGNVIEVTSTLDGSGTANYVTKWVDSNTLTDSQIFDNGTNVGIGTTSPSNLLTLSSQSHTSPSDTNRILNWYGTTGGTELDNSVISLVVGNDSSATDQPRAIGLALFNRNTTNANYSPAITFGGLSKNGNYMNGAAAIAARLTQSGSDANFVNGDLTFYTQSTVGLTEKARITAGGNVGIGTTSPSTLLQLESSNPIITLERNDNGNAAGAINFQGVDNVLDWQLGTNQVVGLGFEINESTTNRFYIAPGGNVGIGTTAPTQKLDVVGNAIFSGNVGVAGKTPAFGLSLAQGTGAGNKIAWTDNAPNFAASIYANSSTDKLTFATKNASNVETIALEIDTLQNATFTGNVGIGTTSPGSKLHIGTYASAGNYVDSSTLPTTPANHLITLTPPSTTGYYGGGIGWSEGTNVAASINAYDAGAGGALGLVFSTGNNTTISERLRIDTDGNVGIGTTSPGSKLQVEGTNPFIRVNNTSADDHGIKISYNGSDAHGLHLLYNANSALSYIDNTYQAVSGQVYGNIYIRQNVGGTMTPRITIKADGGNVGIGTTSPTNTLDVLGSATIRNSSGGGALNIGTNSGRTEYQYITLGGGTGGTDYGWQVGRSPQTGGVINDGFYIYDIKTNNAPFTIALGGNVGIGTASPNARLTVVANDSSNPNVALRLSSTAYSGVSYPYTSIRFGSAYSSYPSWNLASIDAGYTGAAWGGSLLFYTNNDSGETNLTERMRITSSGNVGIGTTNPAYKLEVNGSFGTVTSGIYLEYNSGILYHAGGSGNYYQYISGANYLLSNRTATGALVFSTVDTERMRITSGGNVLIGTTTDSGFKLRVNGEIYADDDIRIPNTFAIGLNGTDNNWRIGRNTITDTGWLTSNTLQIVVFGSSSGQGFQVVNSNGTALFEIDGVQGYTRITSTLGVGVNPSGTTGRIDAANDIVAYSSSDRRLKENIKPIENALDKVKALTGVEFDWKPEHKEAHGYEGHDTGIIAQEVQEVMPTAVRVNDTGYLAVRYEKLIGLLVEANKELAARVEELEKKLK